MTTYLDTLQAHWKDNLGLMVTPALLKGWSQLPEAILKASTENRWQVVQLPAGTGKTQALSAFCASAGSGFDHPGALIVTRFKTEADEIAANINQIAGQTIALASHQDTHHSGSAIISSPVLVITHAAYLAALRELANGDNGVDLLDLYQSYHHSFRKWVFVDEALQWVDAYEADFGEVLAMCGALTGALPIEAASELNKLSYLSHIVIGGQEADRKDKPLSNEHFGLLSSINLKLLQNSIRELSSSDVEIWPSLALQPDAFRGLYRALLESLKTIAKVGYGWVSQRGTRSTLRSSRLLLGQDGMKGVILDATASVDPIYELLGEGVRLVPRPKNIRLYGNVKLNASLGHRVGKEYLAKSGVTLWRDLRVQLSDELVNCSEVLVCTHLDIEDDIKKMNVAGTKMHVAHWGAIDGKNQWRGCDAVVVYGLPYLDDVSPTNSYLAIKGQQLDDWFSSESGAVARRKLKDGFISRSVVQAINRVRCRRTADIHGNAQATDVYVLLPNGRTADVLLKAIHQQMPGIRIVDWPTNIKAKKRVLRSEEELVAILSSLGSGRYSKSYILGRLAINVRTFERMSRKIQTVASDLSARLKAHGVVYLCEVGGRGEAHFVKA